MRVINRNNGSPAVAIVDRLTSDVLMDLVSGKLLAVRYPRFYEPDQCAAVATSLLNSAMRGGYANAKVQRVTKALFEAQTSEADAIEYWENSIRMIETLRSECPHMYPTDLLRLRLDEAWGCTLARFNGRRTNVGLAGSSLRNPTVRNGTPTKLRGISKLRKP